MMQPITVHPVVVTNCHHGTYDLTWGQLAEFQLIDLIGPVAAAEGNVRRHGDVTGVASVEAIVLAAGKVLARHDALRSNFVIGADGVRRQVVAGAGELSMAVYEATGERLDETFEQVATLLSAAAFEPPELPIRLAVVTVDGVPNRLAIAMYHPVADGIAASIVHEEIRRLSLEPDADLPLYWQPREIAEFERGERGRAHAARAEAYVRKQLTTSPLVRRLVTPDEPAEPVDLMWASLNSYATAAATLTLSRRHRVSLGCVLLSAYGVVVGRWLGLDTVPLSLACANREDLRFAGSVANLAQFAPVILRTGAGTFQDICSRTAGASLAAYRYGRHDPDLRRATVAALEQELGAPPWPPYSVSLRLDGQMDFNGEESRTGRAQLAAYAGISDADLRALVGRSVANGGRVPVHPSAGVRFNIWDLADLASMMLMADTTAIAHDGPRLLLAALESFMVEAACDDDGSDVTVLAERAGLPVAVGLG